MKKELNLLKIRASLEEQRQILLDRLKDEMDESQKSYNPDRSDLAWRYSEDQRDVLLSERDEQQLADVEAALKRIENGEYGKCQKCGESIHPVRLEAKPAASFCMACKVDKK